MNLLDRLLHPMVGPVFALVGLACAGWGLAPASSSNSSGLGISFLGYCITIIGFIVTLYKSSRSIQLNDELLKKIEPEIKRYSTVTKIERSLNEQTDIIKKTACKTLIALVDNDIPKLADDIYSFQKNESETLVLDDNYLTRNSPLELLSLLEDGSIWLGVSRINKANWDSHHLHRFLVKSRTLSSQKRLFMRRIYADDGNGFPVSENMRAADVHAGIELRWLREKNGDGVPPDLTLILRSSANPNDAMVDGLDKVLYSQNAAVSVQAVGALVFDIDRSKSLTTVTLYSGDSIEFSHYFQQYRVWWSKSEEIPPSASIDLV